MQRIGIIGGGFSGTMTVVQLILKSKQPLEILIFESKKHFNKGFAYNPYSKRQLLNVITAKMSAFAEKPDHFLDWVMQQKDFVNQDRAIVANSFLPRFVYGEYLSDVWKNILPLATSKNIKIKLIEKKVSDISINEDQITIETEKGNIEIMDVCVIATGNQVPRNPSIKNDRFYKNSKNYFQNPWSFDSVSNIKSDKPVLIIGNGLTMVDTVIGLQENGFKGEIYSISPNGFNILPHRHNGLKYSKLEEELVEGLSLFELVKLVNKHLKSVRRYGVSAEPVIDSLRPHTQKLWKGLSEKEKETFMSRLRHLWGVARHRIPLHIHDKLQQMRIEGKLHINSGKIVDINENDQEITVEYFDKKEKKVKSLSVSRVINCTGPDTDIENLTNSFLKNSLSKGLIVQDPLKLGIRTNTDTFQLIDAKGNLHDNLFTLGSNLKGELWESTAVNELRVQAEKLASILIS